MQVEVVRSNRRRKTVELRPTPNGVRISIPAHATQAEEEKYVRQLLRRYQKRSQSSEIDLSERARQLSDHYGLPHPASIRWVDNQTTRWGSCTPSTGAIRISSSVSKFPSWVLDYVVVHELAHLLIIDHSPEFWNVVGRYEKAERARGYLMAKSADNGNEETDGGTSDIDLTSYSDEEVS